MVVVWRFDSAKGNNQQIQTAKQLTQMETLNMTVSEKRNFYRSIEFHSHSQVMRAIGTRKMVNLMGSAKMQHTAKSKGVLEFLLYLRPVECDGRTMCPHCTHCKANCLVNAGRERLFGNKPYESTIARARRIRTELLIYNRPLFMKVLCTELERARKKAEKFGMRFVVRLNGTSDLPLLIYKLDGERIVERYKDVQFVEYTKVLQYTNFVDKFPNVDYTFSYDGHNWGECQKALLNGVRVSVVFLGELPKKFNGIPVVNGDESDCRCDDPRYCIVGLHYKRTKTTDVSSAFIVKPDDPRCEF